MSPAREMSAIAAAGGREEDGMTRRRTAWAPRLHVPEHEQMTFNGRCSTCGRELVWIDRAPSAIDGPRAEAQEIGRFVCAWPTCPGHHAEEDER